MKRLVYLVVVVLMGAIFFPIGSVCAQTPTKKSLPKVPVIYPGDNDETIIRRAQWIEGAKKEGKVMWWTSYAPQLLVPLIAPFNKIYPFITVDYWRGADLERVNKMESEHSAGHLTVDIMEGGEPTSYPRWRKMGIPEKYIDIIPGLKKMDKRMYSKFGDWTMPEHTVLTPQYNTKLVSAAEAPKTWEDLLNPKWKGQIGLTPDVKVWYMLALDEKGWGIQKTEDFLRKLQQQKLIWVSGGHTAGHKLLIAGEFKIMGETYLHFVPASQAQGAPVEWVRTSPAMVAGSWYIFFKKAPHPNATRLFLEWFLSPQGLLTIEKVTGKGSTFLGAETQQSKALKGLELIYKSEDMQIKAGELGLIDRFSKILGVTPE